MRDAPLRLSTRARAAARAALGPGPEGQVLVTHLHSGIDMTRKLIRCLCPAEWLNDEVMNLYMGLLQVRRQTLEHPCLSKRWGMSLWASRLMACLRSALQRVAVG